MWKRLFALTALGLAALGLSGCAYGGVDIGTADHYTRPQVHVEICPPYCGGQK